MSFAVRRGEVLGEFQTLVQPGMSVPPFIAVLTGITDSMLVDAPSLGVAVPAFLDFAAGSVLVAPERVLAGLVIAMGQPASMVWPDPAGRLMVGELSQPTLPITSSPAAEATVASGENL